MAHIKKWTKFFSRECAWKRRENMIVDKLFFMPLIEEDLYNTLHFTQDAEYLHYSTRD